MVSGFFTSPWDHSRIFSGLASEMRIAEKDSGSFGFSKKEKISRIRELLVSDLREKNQTSGRERRIERSGEAPARELPTPKDSVLRGRGGFFRRGFDQLDVEA